MGIGKRIFRRRANQVEPTTEKSEEVAAASEAPTLASPGSRESYQTLPDDSLARLGEKTEDWADHAAADAGSTLSEDMAAGNESVASTTEVVASQTLAASQQVVAPTAATASQQIAPSEIEHLPPPSPDLSGSLVPPPTPDLGGTPVSSEGAQPMEGTGSGEDYLLAGQRSLIDMATGKTDADGSIGAASPEAGAGSGYSDPVTRVLGNLRDDVTGTGEPAPPPPYHQAEGSALTQAPESEFATLVPDPSDTLDVALPTHGTGGEPSGSTGEAAPAAGAEPSGIHGIVGPSDTQGIVGPSDVEGIIGPIDSEGIVGPSDVTAHTDPGTFIPVPPPDRGGNLIPVPPPDMGGNHIPVPPPDMGGAVGSSGLMEPGGGSAESLVSPPQLDADVGQNDLAQSQGMGTSSLVGEDGLGAMSGEHGLGAAIEGTNVDVDLDT